MLRRNLLATIPLIAAASVLEGCNQTVAQITATTATDLGYLSNGFTALEPLLATIPGVSAAALTTAAADIAKAQTYVQQAAAATSQVAAEPLVQQVEAYFGDALNVLGTLPLPPQAKTIVTALQVLLPVVETAVGLLTTKTASASANMSVSQARATLAAL